MSGSWDLFSSSQPERKPAAQPPAPARAGGVPISPASAGRAYTVTGLNALARQIVEESLPPLWVSGEVTNWKRQPSGHCYFSLRDAQSQVRCFMHSNEARRLPMQPTEGMKVRALGNLNVFERRGELQFVVRELDAVRPGGLWREAFEKLKGELEKEGLLAPERKRPLPRFPRVVGVVTSPVGAALHDVLRVIENRAPWTRVVFCPAKVQGEGAAADIARAIRLFARTQVADVLIVGRGGGSAEDLWAFNEEIVARAIVASPIPVISAVGHEVDVTIADLVADMRAATPSAAAERAVPDRGAIAAQIRDVNQRLERCVARRMDRYEDRLTRAEDDLITSVEALLRERGAALAHAAARLELLSPLASLRRGYALPLSMDGKLLRRGADFSRTERFRLRVADAEVECTTGDVRMLEENGDV